MLQLSETKFGAKHWRSTDARFQLEHVGTVEALSPTDRQRLRDATNLAATAMKNRSGKELAESRSKMDLALPVLRQILGADHPFLATHLNNAALLASNHADFASADRLYREALEIQERALGEDHPAIALSLYNLGVKALQTGDFRRAESLLARSLEMRQRSLGPGHPDVLMSMSRLSAVYFSLGEFSAAEPLMRQFSESASRVSDPTTRREPRVSTTWEHSIRKSEILPQLKATTHRLWRSLAPSLGPGTRITPVF